MKSIQKIYILLIIVFLTACNQQAVLETGTGHELEAAPSRLYSSTGNFPWWNDQVFYQIFVRSFYDSDGDGIGDFNGIVEKLDYLNDGDPNGGDDLGITGIWLMPVHPSPSYHGYDVTDYYDVNPDYGTLEDLQNLVAAAHERGIHVIMDLVINHTSVEHPWFIDAINPESSYRNWYIWESEKPGYLGPWGEPAWHFANGSYYYGVFWSGMPDLNYQNPDVTAEMENIARFWMEEIGVDGFRVDGARHLIEEGNQQTNTESSHLWFTEFNRFYKGINPDALVVGEVWDSSFAAVRYVKNDEFDLVFDFELSEALIEGLNSADAGKIGNAIGFENRLFPNGQMATFITNHDMNRAMHQLMGDEQKARLAAAFLLTHPGVPFIYYGEEIGMVGAKPDEFIRTPMQWDDTPFAGFSEYSSWEPTNRDYPEVNVKAQLEESDSLLRLYRKLIDLRLSYPELRLGEVEVLRTGNSHIYAAIRRFEQNKILLVFNLEDHSVSDYSITITGLESDSRYQMNDLLSKTSLSSLDVPADISSVVYLPKDNLQPGEILIISVQSEKIVNSDDK
jgi:glycosidase